MILNLGCEGVPKSQLPPLFTVTGGTYEYAESRASDGTINWELALLGGTDATLAFTRVVDYVDVFLVGGGSGRRNGMGAPHSGCNGGARVTCSGVNRIAVSNNPYRFTVGGSNESTTIFGKTAETGGGSAGGHGASSVLAPPDRYAEKGEDGEYAFGNAASLLYSGRKYGAGGGGGGERSAVQGLLPGAAGGETGGGEGSSTQADGADGDANTGAGGGGGFVNTSTGSPITSQPGNGGSGIIIIRNAR